jgi:hypothetical protein
MNMTMRKSRQSSRLSGGFSLDEAARLYRASGPGAQLDCPTCGGRMRDVLGQDSSSAIRLVRCEGCGRALVFDRLPDLSG